MREPITVLKSASLKLVDLLKHVSAAEKTMLLASLLAAALLFAFAVIAEDMTEGSTTAFDTRVLLAFRSATDHAKPLGPAWLEVIMRDFTALGGVAILTTVTTLAFGFLLLTEKRHAAWMIVLSVVGGTVLSNLLKWGFARPRPDLVPHATAVYSQSFPSGHAMLSAVVYLTLGALLARTQSDVRVKIYLLSAACALTLIVGLSRIYLGVHWPTDVLAGWVGGAAWALLCWVIMLWLQGKGTIEPPNGGEMQDSVSY